MKITAEKSKYHRFALYYDYAPDRLEFCRSLKDSFGWEKFSYDSEGRRWVFSDPLFVRLFKENYPTINVEPVVVNTMIKEGHAANEMFSREHAIESIKDKKDTTFSVKGLKSELYPYQRVGVEFLTVSGGRAIIADAPGLGKTAQALAYIKHEKYERTLVVCPASVKFAWENEVQKWTNLSSVAIESKTKLHEIDSSVNVWVINYDLLKKFLPELKKIRFDCLIGDEAHMVKSAQAQRTKAFIQIARHIPSVVMLTGTPLLSRPVELFTLLHIIDPKSWNNYYNYVRAYCNAHQTRFGFDVSGASNIDELYGKIRRYFLRRRKEEVLTDLPNKNRIAYPVEMSTEIGKLYREAERNLGAYLKNHSGKQPAAIAKVMQAEKLAQLNVLRQLCANGKLETAYDIIDSIIESGEKVLVFSSFIEPLNKLHDRYGDKSVMLTGQTPIADRGPIVNRFQKDDSIKVFLGGIKSAGVGITLTAASNVVFLDYSWNPADHQQAEDRAHRIGQKASVNVYQLFAKDTIDEKLQKVLEKKQKIFDRLIEGEVPQKEEGDESISSILKEISEK